MYIFAPKVKLEISRLTCLDRAYVAARASCTKRHLGVLIPGKPKPHQADSLFQWGQWPQKDFCGERSFCAGGCSDGFRLTQVPTSLKGSGWPRLPLAY